MGNNSNVKELRKQLRTVVAELLPEVLAGEAFGNFRKGLEADQREQLTNIHKLVRETLERIDNRQKDVQSMIMRELNKGQHSLVPATLEEKKVD